MVDFTGLNSSTLTAFGATYTYTPSGGTPIEITAIRGDLLEPGVHTSLWATIDQFDAEPMKNDAVTVGSGRGIPAGNYRVADVKRDDESGRRLMLSWAGRP